jgi:NADH-quinone oxidoreductase subunit J
VTELVLFWTCCLGTIVGAIGAAVVRNIFHASLLLGVSLVGAAGLYLFLEAYYLACVQIVVYVGGVLVLILFATLFAGDVLGHVYRAPGWLRGLGVVGALISASVAVRLAQVAIAHGKALEATRTPPGQEADVIAGQKGTIGDLLVGSWLVPFLAAGLLLTIALVGAVATVRRYQQPAGAAAEVAHD